MSYISLPQEMGLPNIVLSIFYCLKLTISIKFPILFPIETRSFFRIPVKAPHTEKYFSRATNGQMFFVDRKTDSALNKENVCNTSNPAQKLLTQLRSPAVAPVSLCVPSLGPGQPLPHPRPSGPIWAGFQDRRPPTKV